jgi:CO/xanthine dehydrogenase FAD-binding subunit
MATPRFTFHQPQNLEQALDMVGMYRTNGKILAGGTDLVPKLRAGLADVQHVVSLNRVPGLNRITFQEDDGLVIGAGARLCDVAAHPEVQKHYPGSGPRLLGYGHHPDPQHGHRGGQHRQRRAQRRHRGPASGL